MNKREDIVQKFSTFLSFGDRQFTWQPDPKLEQQMKRLVQSDPEAKEEFWARYFLKRLREVSPPETDTETEYLGIYKENHHTCSPVLTRDQTLEISTLIATRHLSAYLQEACFWAAQKSFYKYKFLRHKYPLEEYLQIASSFANLPGKLLKNFDLERSESKMIAYAKTAIFRFVRNKIYRQNRESKIEKFGNYGLLKNLSFKELNLALSSQGFEPLEIDLYGLAWQSFNKFYQSHKRVENQNLPDDQYREDLKQITEDCNQRLNQQTSIDLSRIVVNEDKIQEMLTICIKAARNYRTKQFCPLEECNKISDPTLTPLDIAVQEEERQQVQLLVSKLFTAIPEAGQIMLILWQGLNLTQSEIATVMKSKYPELQKQYQVARHLAKHKKNILKNFIGEWNQDNPNHSINSEQDLERIQDALDDCFQHHCQELLNSILEQTTRKLQREDNLLVGNLKPSMINLDNRQIFVKISRKKQVLTKVLTSKLELDFSLPREATLPVFNKILNFVDQWLVYYKY
ncbi:hypothetical protein ACL6C3_13110 [Capilliphycus salinus ALCB114379]|uniref:hypothetical protein n=1 Tax=Capilliphycus salinus TaxID=2768948 RepID=UPI0039A6E9AB